MNQRLIYVVGPSGAGKDSLLNWLRVHLPLHFPVAWARRTINRPGTTEGELHESVTTAQFDALIGSQLLAMHWSANDHLYGIRHSELAPLAQGQWIFVNGSRAHLPVAAKQYPGLTVLHITADIEVLQRRLLSRGRETLEAIANRLQRIPPLVMPLGCTWIEIQNNHSLEASGQQLLVKLRTLANWTGN